MQFFAVIPYIAVLVAVAFVAVSAVWDSNRRAVGSMTEIFLCLTGWALIDLCGQLESDPNKALIWLKLVHLPAPLLGVCVVRLLIQMIPRTAARLRPWARAGWVFAVGAGLAATVLPGVVDGATATAWGGWMPHYGIVSMLLIPIGCILPLVAAIQVRAVTREFDRSSRATLEHRRSNAVSAAVGISLVAVLSTEYLFPLYQLPVPRLGALAAVVASASLWVRLLYRSDDLTIAPQATARAVLAELQDGVALVDRSGAILKSNPRLGAILGYESEELLGRSMPELVGLPLALIPSESHEREFLVEASSGVRIPVSLSSYSLRNRRGDANWSVIVLRDLRNVDALRRRLLTSGRLAAVGELAAGIAHEVNNPVAFIRSDLNFLRSRLAEIESTMSKESANAATQDFVERGTQGIDEALQGIERIAEVVGDVRSFAYMGSEGSGAADPGPIIESAVRLAGLENRNDLRLNLVAAEISERVASGQDFKQVVLALLRVLTSSAAEIEKIAIESELAGALLRTTFVSELARETANEQLARFGLVREDILGADAGDLGLAMALELVDQLGGSLQVDAPTPKRLRIALDWPIEQDEVEP